MNGSPNQTPYAILGEEGIRNLVNCFYDVMDSAPEAADIRAMHGEDLSNIRRMLTAYLTTWMGGPPVYLALKGSMCLTDAHAPYHIGPKAAEQWLWCMEQALGEIEAGEELRDMLAQPFKSIVAAVQNQSHDHTPESLIARG